MTASNDTGGAAFVTTFDRDFVAAPLVSVIVTCFNYERYIGDCLRSIMNQTYPRMECLVVDDCSTDSSVQAIRDFIAANEEAAGFRLLSNEVNGGQMRSFLTGFQNSSGAFVVFVDADDMLFPDFVETHVNAHLNIAAAAGMSCSDEVVIDSANAVVAGSIENGLRGFSPRRWFSRHLPIEVLDIDGWHGKWGLGGEVSLNQADEAMLFVAPSGNITNRWIWSTTSAVMFRRGILELTLSESISDIRICADFYLFHIAHLIGGTLLIQSAHGFYRRHGSNHFASNAVIGTGAEPGAARGAFSPENLWLRVRSELIDQFDRVSAIIGVRRALLAVAMTISVPDSISISRIAADRLPSGRAKFVLMVALVRARRLVHTISRTLRLI